jgi:hypothetical protein
MSVEYCDVCDRHIDTDFDTTHKEECHPGRAFIDWLDEEIGLARSKADKGNWNAHVRMETLKDVLKESKEFTIEDYNE